MPESTAPPASLPGFDALDALAEVEAGIACLDAGWRVVFANAAWGRALGVAPSAHLGRSVWELFPGLDGTPGAAALRACQQHGSAAAVRLPAVGGASAVTRRLVGLRARRTADGLVVLTLPDVAELERLHDEHERLGEIARAMAAIADSTTLLDALCTAAARLCLADGATVAELEGEEGHFVATHAHPLEVLGHRFPLDGTLTGRIRREHRRTGGAALLRADAREADDAAYNPWLADGRRVAHLLLAPLQAHGDLLGVLAVSRAEGEPPFDEADEARVRVVADHASLALWKARLVEEARAASETKSNFLAAVSHELRTPLTALTGYGELLADEIVGPLTGDQGEVVERMRAVTHQLTGMIEEILTYSALEAGRERVRTRPVRMDEVLGAVRAVAEPLAEARGLALTLDPLPDLPVLESDPDKVRQILVNLVGNAIKFTERGGVRVTVDAPGAWLRCAVADTGVGIAAGDLGRLFQPFAQLDGGLTRRYGGTGLGLYISQRLARLLGGRIEVVSQPGVGSLFTLLVPLGGPHVLPGDGARG